MKSSLFTSDPPRPASSAKFKSSLRKSATVSPSIGSTSGPPQTKSKPKPTPLPSNSSKKVLSWNLDDLINSYQESRILPPILSPTLPDSGKESVKPSVEPQTKQSNGLSLKSPKPKYPTKRKILDLEDDYYENDHKTKLKSRSPLREVENVNISMLSPTLPPIFDKNDILDRPEKQVTTKSSKAGTPVSRLVTVKWIKKLHDTTKPKFLVRIAFVDTAKYKQSVKKDPAKKKTGSPVKLAGLGILASDKTNTSKEDDSKFFLSNDNNEITKRENDLKHKLEAQVQKENILNELQKKTSRKEKELDSREQKLQERENQLHSLEKSLQDRESKLKQAPASTDLTHEQQKKLEQIKQLNQDVLLKELRRPYGEQNTVSSTPFKAKLSQQQREEIKTSLLSKKNHWVQLVKSSRLTSEKQTDEFVAIIIEVDILLMCMIAYDYDERSKVVIDVLPSERNWKLLELDIKNLLQRISKYALTLKERNLIEFMKILTCILFQTRALVVKRIDSILAKVINLYLKKLSESKDNDLKTRIIELQQSCIKNHKLINDDFMSSRPEYLNAIIPIKFPKTWFKKSTSEKSHLDQLDDYSSDLKPSTKTFYLPIGIYSELNEISGFLFNIIKEFIDIFNKYNPKNKIHYVLQSGK